MKQPTHTHIRNFSLLAFFLVSLAFSWINCTIPLPECTKAPCVREGFVEVQGVCVLAENKDNVAKTCQLEPTTETTPEPKTEPTPEPVTSDAGEPSQPDTSTSEQPTTEPTPQPKCAEHTVPFSKNVKQLPSTGSSEVRDLVADEAGHIYLVGQANTDICYDKQGAILGEKPISFLARLNADGTWGWFTILVGDASNNVIRLGPKPSDGKKRVLYFGGSYQNSLKLDAYSLQNKQPKTSQSFVGSIDIDGKVQWLMQAGISDKHSHLEKLALRDNGDIILIGSFSGTIQFGSLPTSRAATRVRSSYVASLRADGQQWNWSTHTTGTLRDIAISQNDAIWLTGEYNDEVIFGTESQPRFKVQRPGEYGIYVTTISFNGSWLHAINATSPKQLQIVGMQIKERTTTSAKMVYVQGQFFDTLELVPGSPLVSKGGKDVFLAKISNETQFKWEWSFSFGSKQDEEASHFRILPDDLFLLAGTYGDAMVLDKTLQPVTQGAPHSIYVAVLDPKHSTPVWKWSTSGGSSDSSHITSMAFLPNDQIAIGGGFGASGTFGPVSLRSLSEPNGYGNGFIWKLPFYR